MTSQKKKSTKTNRKKLNLLLLLLNLVLLGLLAVFMLNRPNQSEKQSTTGTQTSQSKTISKWKTYDEPVQIPILMYHAVHVMDPSEASNANLIVDPDLFEAQIKALV